MLDIFRGRVKLQPVINLQQDVALDRPARMNAAQIRQALENAIAASAGSGGSTNSVLHTLAFAREAGIEFTVDDIEAISKRTPLIVDMKPTGKYTAIDMHAAGGNRLLAQRLLEGGYLHGDCMTVSGKTLAEEAASAHETPGQDVVRPLSNPAAARRSCTGRSRWWPWLRARARRRTSSRSP